MAAPVRNVRDLLARRWGVSFTSRESTMAVQVALTSVLKQNPARVAVLLVNDGAFQVLAAPQGSGFEGAGSRIDPSGGSLFLWWEEDGELPAREWVAVAVGGVSTLDLHELIIESPGPEPTAALP